MLKSYLTIALRNILRYKSYSLINILGLAVGIAATVIILLYVQDQLSYDKFYKNADRIYRLNLDVKSPGGVNKYATTSAPMGPFLSQKFPEFNEAVRVRSGSAALIQFNDIKAYEERILFVDSNFFNLFSFALKSGNPEEALAEPNSIILTDESARKYFGNENPIGKNLLMDGRFNLKVTGVLSPKKLNSHIKFDFLISFSTFPSTLPPGYDINDWGWTSFYTYLKLNNNSNEKQAEAKLPEFVELIFGKETAKRISLNLQPVTEIYFDNERTGDFGAVGNKSALYILAAVAALSLLIACFNFINLSTARSARRGREVGMRKVLGAQRMQLIKQFIGESVILSFISVIIAVGLIEFFIGTVAKSLDVNITLMEIPKLYLISSLLILPVLVGTISGIYPAFVLSKFLPSKVLKGNYSSGSSGILLRKFLVVSQFVVSTVLIIGTLVIAEQMSFIRSKNLGFDKGQIIVLKLRGEEALGKYETLKSAILQNAEIASIGGARNSLDGGFGSTSVVIPAGEGVEPERFDTYTYPVHYNFFETLNMKFVSGRSFKEEFTSDSVNTLILNEAAAKQFGLKNAVGKQIRLGGGQLSTIIGIVEDFHYTSLHNKIDPLVFYVSTYNAENMFVKLHAGDIPIIINKIEKSWNEILPQFPMEFSFLDDRINNVYKTDVNFASLVNLFSALAVFIACLGLFGLTSYMTEQRTKEIGIRKVLGASVANVLVITTRQFIILITLANFIAWPLANYFMNNWLEDFAFRIDIGIETFILSAAVIIFIAVFTISFQAIKAALANPVKSLRYE